MMMLSQLMKDGEAHQPCHDMACLKKVTQLTSAQPEFDAWTRDWKNHKHFDNLL
jgi:hypothetical protein